MRAFLYCILLFATYIGNAQRLTIKDLLYLQTKMDSNFVKGFLLKRGFHETERHLQNEGEFLTIDYTLGKKGKPGYDMVILNNHQDGKRSITSFCNASDTVQLYKELKTTGFHLKDSVFCAADAQIRYYMRKETDKLGIEIWITSDLLYPSEVYCNYFVFKKEEE